MNPEGFVPINVIFMYVCMYVSDSPSSRVISGDSEEEKEDNRRFHDQYLFFRQVDFINTAKKRKKKYIQIVDE